MKNSMQGQCVTKWVVVAAGVLWVTSAHAQWMVPPGAQTGSDENAAHQYLNGDNWYNGYVNDWFTNNLTGALTLYFNGDHTITNDLRTMWIGNQDMTWKGSGGPDRTVTLKGDIIHQIVTTGTEVKKLNIGNNEANRRIVLDIADTGTPHEIWTGFSDRAQDVAINDWMTGGGDIVKYGIGTLDIRNNANTFTGNITVNAGLLLVRGGNSLPSNTGSLVTINPNAVMHLENSYNTANDRLRRFVFNDGTIRVNSGTTYFQSILEATTPIMKDGAGRFTLEGSAAPSNEFTKGFIVMDGSLQLANANRMGPDIAKNDFVAFGGSITVNAQNILGANQKLIVDTTNPARMSGVGLSANVGFPPFEICGTNPGVIVLDTMSTEVTVNPVIVALLQSGWYLGTANGVTYNGNPIPVGFDKTYRLGGGASVKADFVITAPNVLTGDNAVSIGSPVAMYGGLGSLVLQAPQDYTGETIINSSPRGTMYLTLGKADGAVTATPKIILSATNTTVGHTELRISELVTGRSVRMNANTDIELSSGSASAYFRVMHNVANVDSTNVVGHLVLKTGRSHIVQGQDSGSTLANVFFTTEASSLKRQNRSLAIVYTLRQNDTTSYLNPSIGVRRSGTYAGGNQIFLNNTNLLTLIGSANTSGTDQPVIPYLIACDNSDNQAVSSPSTLMTYHSSTGLRALRVRTDIEGNLAEFKTTVAAAGADDNVRKDNTGINGTETVAASKTINSLLLREGGVNVTNGETLTIKSGVLWACGGSIGNSGGIEGAIVDFGDAEGIIYHTSGSVTTINASLSGTNGITVFGNPSFCGRNTYTGQTTIVGGRTTFFRTSQNLAGANDSIPDDGHVLIHPAAILQIGSDNAAYCTREIIGSIGGEGTIQLGNITIASPNAWRNSTLFIGQNADTNGISGRIVLDGGTISPGMPGEIGTLSVTTAVQTGQGLTPIPVDLINGDVNVRVADAGRSSVLSVLGAVTIGCGTNLVLNVTVEPTVKLHEGQAWTVITAGGGVDNQSVNSDKLFTQIVSGDEKWKFEAAVVDGNAVVLTAHRRMDGTLIMVR